MPISKPVLIAGAVTLALALGAAVLVSSTLRRPEVPTWPPSPAGPREVGGARVGPVVYTVDASAPEVWRYFDFSSGSLVESPGPLGWDLAFRRFAVIVNGGEGFAGEGGVVDLGDVAFGDVARAPEGAYEGSAAGRDSVNAVLQRWYDYGFATHLLTPKPRVYVVRTADGRFAKLAFLSYYCPGARPGCVTFRYVYEGGGGRDLGR